MRTATQHAARYDKVVVESRRAFISSAVNSTGFMLEWSTMVALPATMMVSEVKSYLQFHFSPRKITESPDAATIPMMELVESRVRSAYGRMARCIPMERRVVRKPDSQKREQ